MVGATLSKKNKSWFFGIGIDTYKHFQDLSNAKKDITDVQAILYDKYDIDECITLVNEEATRENIIKIFEFLQLNVEVQDKLLIMFSGHGDVNENKTVGYWIPHDATSESTANYLRNSTILEYVREIPSLHTLLISDSCYSSSIFSLGTLRNGTKALSNLEKIKSRWALCSGRKNEPVSDGIPGENSPFVSSIIKVLKENKAPKVNIGKIADIVMNETRELYAQLPQGKPLINIGDEGGQYVFNCKLQKISSSTQMLSPFERNQQTVFLKQPNQVVKISESNIAEVVIENYISKGEIEKALAELLVISKESKLLSLDEVLSLQSRLSKINRDRNLGVLNQTKYYETHAQIVHAVTCQYLIFKAENGNIENLSEESLEEIENDLNNNDSDIESTTVMNPSKKLVRAYFSLSNMIRLQIANEVGLRKEGDNNLELMEQHKRIFLRAKDENKLPELWDKVMEALGATTIENPYHK